VHWAVATVALTLLAFAAISGRIAGTPITAAMIFTAVGLLVGSEVLGLIEVAPAGDTVELLAEANLALVLFADASRIDVRALRGELSVPLRLLGVGLPLTLLAGFVLALVVFPELSWSEALLLAVILAPTDAAAPGADPFRLLRRGHRSVIAPTTTPALTSLAATAKAFSLPNASVTWWMMRTGSRARLARCRRGRRGRCGRESRFRVGVIARRS